MPKRTYQPSKIKKVRQWGFRNKNRRVVRARRLKGRKRVAI